MVALFSNTKMNWRAEHLFAHFTVVKLQPNYSFIQKVCEDMKAHFHLNLNRKDK